MVMFQFLIGRLESVITDVMSTRGDSFNSL